MDLSNVDGIMERAFSGKEPRPKTLSTELFPGMAENIL